MITGLIQHYLTVFIIFLFFYHDNITETYKKASPDAETKNDKESKQFAKHLETDDRQATCIYHTKMPQKQV